MDAFLYQEPCLERMGSGDVGHGEPLCVTVAPYIAVARVRGRVVEKARRLLQNTDIGWLHFWLPRVAVGEKHRRRAAFDQETVSPRRAPTDLENARWPENTSTRSLRCHEGRSDARATCAVVLGLRVETHLVFLRRLPGQSEGVGVQAIEAEPRSIRVGGVERRALRLVEEYAGE